MRCHCLMRGVRAKHFALVAPIVFGVALSSSFAGEEPLAKSQIEREYDETVAKLVAERKAIPKGENAADDYARAFDALPPQPDDELDFFLTSTAIDTMPTTLREFPGAIDEVRKLREAVTVHLRRGASKKLCMFEIDWRAGAGILLPHLAKSRDLARRAIMYGKLLELEGRSGEAAHVYLDVIRMGLHLEQDGMLFPSLLGIAIVGIGGPQIEGLLAREPEAATVRFIFKGLRDLPRGRFDVARVIGLERVVFGGWMRKEIGDRAKKGRDGIREILKEIDGAIAMFGDGIGEHKPWRIPEEPAEIRREIDEVFGVYHRQTRRLVSMMKKPFHETRREIMSLEKTQTSYWNDQIADGRFAAALLGYTAGTSSMFQIRAVRGEARLRGLEILAAAALTKAERGEYPADLKSMRARFPKGAPVDPLSGKPFRYWLAEGTPAVLCEADNPKTAKARPETYHFGLAYRLKLELRVLEWWHLEQKRRAEEDALLDEQEADPDNAW